MCFCALPYKKSHETAKDGVSMTPRSITTGTTTGLPQRGLCRPKSWKRRWTKAAENMSMSEDSIETKQFLHTPLDDSLGFAMPFFDRWFQLVEFN